MKFPKRRPMDFCRLCEINTIKLKTRFIAQPPSKPNANRLFRALLAAFFNFLYKAE